MAGLSDMTLLRRQTWVNDFSASLGWFLFQPAVDKCWPTSAAKMTTLLHILLSWKAEQRLENEKEVMGYERYSPCTYCNIYFAWKVSQRKRRKLRVMKDTYHGMEGLSSFLWPNAPIFSSPLKKHIFSISVLLWVMGFSGKVWTVLVISVTRFLYLCFSG